MGSDHPTIQETSGETPSEIYNRFTASFDDQRTTGRFEVVAVYPAQSAAEADAAESGDLSIPEWYTGPERVREIFVDTASQDDRLRMENTTAHRSYWPDTDQLSVEDPEHGWIVVKTDVWWYNYSEPEENITIGQEYIEALGPGWDIQVIAPSEWEPTAINGNPGTQLEGQKATEYRWQLTGNESLPLIEFDSPVTFRTESGDGSLKTGPLWMMTILLGFLYAVIQKA